jgi:uncharacterized membrane protein
MILWDILTFPIVAPVKGTVWVIEQIRDKALEEMYDPDKLRADLIQLRIRYERGAISEEEYSQQSETIWEQLKLVTADSEGDNDGDDADEK